MRAGACLDEGELLMNGRIQRLAQASLESEIYPECAAVEVDPFDDKLAEPMMIAKRLTDYMLAQPISLSDDSHLIGLMQFNKSPVPADIFRRNGYRLFHEAWKHYGASKPQENLCTMEWQHSNANFGKVIRNGLMGHIDEINASRAAHAGKTGELMFLTGLEMTIQGIARRVDQYRAYCVDRAEKTSNPERQGVLRRMAGHLKQVPMRPARTFEEGIQGIYICFMFLNDSLGRPDQYLYPLFRQDMDSGALTRDRAIELVQELFVMVCGSTPHTPWTYDKGAESHFVVGGLTPEGEDAFNSLSALIMEAMMDLPLIRPQVSLRWNRKTPREVLRLMMDYERKDRFKRIAFVNDEPRVKALMEINGLSFKAASDYIMVGCNEPAFQGGISLGGNTVNIVRPLLDALNGRRAEVLACAGFDAFYAIFEQELFKALETILNWSNRFNMLRSRDCNVLSSLFLDGCIERARSANSGGAKLARYCANFMGSTNLVDSLCVIRQFVYEEKRIGFRELLEALDRNWEGAGDLRASILRCGRFFGNHDEFSDSVARRFYTSVGNFARGRRDIFGTPLSYGNLTGYNTHFERYGALTGATPDGRTAGSALTFGSGQVYGKDRDGATSHLLSVAKMDPTGIMCGNTIMNLTVDEETVRGEEGFAKLVLLVETYFKAGGLHLQLNHIAREELLAAKADPGAHRNIRVRVSGFSATFVDLEESLQDNVIERTVAKV